MEYLRKFETTQEYNEALGVGIPTPNVCYIEETKGVSYEPAPPTLFPAILVPSDVEKLSNYTIAEYFWNNYPDMIIVNNRGEYTPITEDVTIQGSLNCDGKVIGVAKWGTEPEIKSLLFYTENSISKLYALKIYYVVDDSESVFITEFYFD